MIRIKNLSHRYRNREEDAIRGVDIHIKKGESVVVIGPSGSGKTA